MPCFDILRESQVITTPRVLQMASLFDVPLADRSRQEWHVAFSFPEAWHVGVIVGPSGSGKTTLARTLWPEQMQQVFAWDEQKSILDMFPAALSIKDIVQLLSAVGFASPPLWVRPFHVLSTGEQFRVSLARLLAEQPQLAVMDEYTSVVDRTVAQIGSAALAKAVRMRQQQFVAVTCHYDVLDWLEPDWVYEPQTNVLHRGGLWRRPPIALEIRRVHHSAWRLFHPYHYLSADLQMSTRCFVAWYADRPVAFASVIHFQSPSRLPIKREHRTVCLPDFQGVGIGNALSNYIASVCKALGFRYLSMTSHPSMMHTRLRSGQWSMLRPPSLSKETLPKGSLLREKKAGRIRMAGTRFMATFEYIGPPLLKAEAQAIWNGC